MPASRPALLDTRLVEPPRSPASGMAGARGTSGLPMSDQEVVVQLCRMPVDMAAPLLNAHIASLTPQALIAIIALTGEAHQVLIAQRPGLDARVIDALLRCPSERVLTALAANNALELRDTHRKQLQRLAMDRPALAAVLATPGERITHSNLKLLALLRAGDVQGFVTEAAKRVSLSPILLGYSLTTPSLVPFALLICALDIDRAVFFDLAVQWQTLHHYNTDINTAYRPLLLSVFTLEPLAAAHKLAALAASENP